MPFRSVDFDTFSTGSSGCFRWKFRPRSLLELRLKTSRCLYRVRPPIGRLFSPHFLFWMIIKLLAGSEIYSHVCHKSLELQMGLSTIPVPFCVAEAVAK